MFLFLVAGQKPGLATSVIIPSDNDLIVGARLVVKARVLSVTSAFDPQRNEVFTYVRLRVQQVLKGALPGRNIVLKEPGGSAAGQDSIVFGSPEFSPGEEDILYLDTWPDGSLRVHQMFLGKFAIKKDSGTGELIVERAPMDAGTNVAGRSGSGQITERMKLSGYIKMIRARLEQNSKQASEFESKYYASSPLLPCPPEFKQSAMHSLSPEFHLMIVRARWFEADSGGSVAVTYNPDGAFSPQIAGDIAIATQTWSSVNGSLLRVGIVGTSGECIPYGNSAVNIVFDNCDGRHSQPVGCTGILAISGLFADPEHTMQVSGTVFRRAIGGFTSVNPYMACIFADHCKLQEVLTHEMGHVLGLHHSWQPGFSPAPTALEQDASMFWEAHFDGRCSSLRVDDLNGIRFIYPGSSGNLAVATDAALPAGTAGASYSVALSASGETPPYTWSGVPLKGQLPPGLTLSAGGVISGTPSALGSFPFTIQVVDSASHAAQKTFVTTIGEMPLSASVGSLPFGVKGTPYSGQLVAAGGLPPYTWAVSSGILPAGLSLAGGLISGTATATGNFGFIVSVGDQTGPNPQNLKLQILIVSPDQVPDIISLNYKSGNGRLTVSGSNFDPNAQLLIDGTKVSTKSIKPAVIVARSPRLPTGSHQVVIVNPGGITSSPALLSIN